MVRPYRGSPYPRVRASTPPTQTATIHTSNDTFVAPAAGVYRVLCISSGAGGAATSGGIVLGAGSGFVVYAEVPLSASENVTVTVGAAASGSSTTDVGTRGNPTSFGSYVVSPGGGPANTVKGGDGFCGGGGSANGSGGTDGSDGAGTNPGRGQGNYIIDFLNAKFPDLTFASGAPDNGSGQAGGGAGVNINGSGNYGRGGTTGLSTGGASLAGVLVVAGPYPS